MDGCARVQLTGGGGSTNATARDLMRKEGVTVVSLGGRFFYPKAEVLALIKRSTLRRAK